MSQNSMVAARRSPPSRTPWKSAPLIAVMVSAETNLASWKRSFSPTTISLMRFARSPISSRERTPSTRASKLPSATWLATRSILPIGRLIRSASRIAPATATATPISDHRPRLCSILLDREIGVALALLDQDRPGERARKGERPEHHLAIGPGVGLDADDLPCRSASSPVASATISWSVRSVGCGGEDLLPVGIDDRHRCRSG